MQNNLSPTTQLRYNICERLEALDRDKVLAIRKHIIESTRVVASTYHRWLLLKRGATADIPARVLRMFARELDVTMEELFNG